MKVLEWKGPEQMVYSDAGEPKLETGWVMIEVEAAGICGSELSGYLGHNSLRKPPLIMGHEFTGTVNKVGKGGTAELVGKLVTVNPLISCGSCRACNKGNQQLCADRRIIGIHMPGAFAEYVIVPESQCHIISNKIEGAMTEPLACSLRAVNKAKIQMGDKGVVIGAGVIGLMAIRLMKQKGASEIIALDTNNARLESAAVWGASHVFNPLETDVLKEILHVYPEGADQAIDAVGYSKTRKQAIDSLGRGGQAIFIGLHEDEALLSGNEVVRNEIEISGTFCYSANEFSTAVSLIDNGFLEGFDKNWYDVRPLETGDQAFQEQISANAQYSKIVLVP